MFEEYKIISGGQSGADLGGIRFAQKYKIDYEVNTFKGFKPIRGTLQGIKVNYVTDKIGVDGLRYRTEYNVKKSDITIIFIQKALEKTKGSRLTAKFCQYYHKDHIIIKVVKNPLYFGEDKYKEEYTCEYKKDGNKIMIELRDILYSFMVLREDLKKDILIINIAGERYWDENKVVKILEEIFDEVIERNKMVI